MDVRNIKHDQKRLHPLIKDQTFINSLKKITNISYITLLPTLAKNKL